MILDGVASTASLKDKINANSARIEELKSLVVDKQEIPVLLHPNMGLHYRKEVQALITALNNPDYRHEAADMIRGLIEKITLTPKLGGGLTIDLHGDLAGILTIASGKKGAAVRELIEQVRSLTEPSNTLEDDDFNQQQLLVAGTGGQQCLSQQELLVAGARNGHYQTQFVLKHPTEKNQ